MGNVILCKLCASEKAIRTVGSDPNLDRCQNDSDPGCEDGALSDSNTSFLRAARSGNIDKVLEFLKGGQDIATCNQNGLNALHLAAKEGHRDLVEELLERGAAVDSSTKKGNTALHIACLAGQKEVARLLVKRGADVNSQSQNGFTPLYMASQENHLEVVRYLLENGGNQSTATEDGFTPLAIALQQGHNAVVSLLLEHDTKGKVRLPALHIAARKDDTKSAALLLQNDHNADVQSKNGITPLHVASKRGNTNMIALLLDRGAQIDAKTRDGLTPLHCAARSGHDPAVELLLERGAPILARTKNGLSPLHMSAQGDHVECVKHLLQHKAPVDDVTLDYLTALHVAAHCGHYRVTKLLLDKRANPNARALNGFTPLHIACKKNRVKVMELLVKYGASIQAITESGLTPIHVSAFMGHLNIVLLLLQNGASPDVRNIRGETALHMAARAGQMEVVRCLLRNGALVDAMAREDQTPLHIASRLGKTEIVQLLLQHMAHPDAATTNGYTPLHISAREGQLETAAVLLEAGASHSLATKKGFTPLHVAAKYGSLDVAKLLLKKHALPDDAGKNGLTPLHVAAHYDNQEVALLLLENGASPHATAKNGYTPLHIAAKKNQTAIASALMQYGAETNVLTKQGVSPLHLASQEGHSEMAALLLERGSVVNASTKTGLTSLHLAAQEDKVNVAETLAKNNANLDHQTKLGYTPLIVACHYGNVKMVNFLVQQGASVNAKTKSGYTPLHQAAQQGNTHVINVLLQHGAKPNAITVNGNTALSIAKRLGYISVVDTLKVVTEEIITTTTTITEKHKLNVPETMTEVLDVSDEEVLHQIEEDPFSDESVEVEGEDTMTGDGGEYLRAEDLRELGDDSLPGQYLDGMTYLSHNLDRSHGTPTHPEYRDGVFIEEMLTSHQVATLARENDKDSYRLSWGAEHLDNVILTNTLLQSGSDSPFLDNDNSSFLVSFMVDARGGTMRGCRHNGLRIMIPPQKCSAPTRVTCRLVKRHRLASMPPMVDGEGLAGRIIEVGPTGAQFLGPVIVEIPHFAALRGTERELVILRSETGESWREHHCEHTEEELNQILNGMDEALDSPEELEKKRICRIITRDFPQYFAVVSRIKQDSHLIGPEGGVLSSTLVPTVQAVFPEGALTKRIRVGLQAQPVHADLVKRILGNKATFSPIVTLEPRRRKFHKPITMTIPVPKSSTSDGTNCGFGGDTPTLRLLCSITGGTTPAQWEDITGSTPLTFVNQCVSFTTNVSARFWLIDCRQIQESVNFSSQVYREMICVPYMAKFVIFAKTLDPIEARLRCFCMTDDKMDKTLEQQENFTEVARSRDVEVLEGKPIFADCFGNLVPLTKSGQHHVFSFFAFKENRLALFIKVRDSAQEPCGRLSFTKEPRTYRSLAHSAICNLNITLPTYSKDSDSDQDADDESDKTHDKLDWQDDADRKEETLAIVSDLLGFSWTELAKELEFNEDEIQVVRSENPNSLQEQSQALLQRWVEREAKHATEDCLIKRLTAINRMDIVHLLETQMNKSVQEQTSRTYAEIERTLDHSEALSSVQEDVDSPRLVRRVESSQRQPPAVSEEDLSVASLLDVPSWSEPLGHTRSESMQGDLLEELDITQDFITNPWAAREIRAGSSNEGLDRQVSQLHCTIIAEPSMMMMMSQVNNPQTQKVSPMQKKSLMVDLTGAAAAAAFVPWDYTEHGVQPGLTTHPHTTQADVGFIECSSKSTIPSPGNPLVPVSIRDFGRCLTESDHAETDFSDLLAELRGDLVDMKASTVDSEDGHSSSSETISSASEKEFDSVRHNTQFSTVFVKNKALSTQRDSYTENSPIPFIDEFEDTTSVHYMTPSVVPLESERWILQQETHTFQDPESIQGSPKPYCTQAPPNNATKYDQLANSSTLNQHSLSIGHYIKDDVIVRPKTSLVTQGQSHISNTAMTSKSCDDISAVIFDSQQLTPQPVIDKRAPVYDSVRAEVEESKYDSVVAVELIVRKHHIQDECLVGSDNEESLPLPETQIKENVSQLAEIKPAAFIMPHLTPCIVKSRDVPQVAVATTENIMTPLFSEDRGNQYVSCTPETSIPSSPESVVSQGEFQPLYPGSQVPDYRGAESISCLRQSSPKSASFQNRDVGIDIEEFYSNLGIDNRDSNVSLPRYICSRPEPFASVSSDLFSEDRGNHYVSCTPETSIPSYPESVGSQREFQPLYPGSQVPDYRGAESISCLRQSSPKSASRDRDVGLDIDELYSNLGIEERGFDVPLPRYICSQPEPYNIPSSPESVVSQREFEPPYPGSQIPNYRGAESISSLRQSSPKSASFENRDVGLDIEEFYSNLGIAVRGSDVPLPRYICSQPEPFASVSGDLFSEDRGNHYVSCTPETSIPSSPESVVSQIEFKCLYPGSQVPDYRGAESISCLRQSSPKSASRDRDVGLDIEEFYSNLGIEERGFDVPLPRYICSQPEPYNIPSSPKSVVSQREFKPPYPGSQIPDYRGAEPISCLRQSSPKSSSFENRDVGLDIEKLYSNLGIEERGSDVPLPRYICSQPEPFASVSGDLFSEDRGNHYVSCTPETSIPSSPESVVPQIEFKCLYPSSQVSDYRGAESISCLRQSSPKSASFENRDVGLDIDELYSNLGIEDRGSDVPLPRYICSQPEPFASVPGEGSSCSEEKTRLHSLESMSRDEQSPQFADSPLPEYDYPIHEKYVYTSKRWLCSSSIGSGMENNDFSDEGEERPNSSESSCSLETYRHVSTDSPIPLYSGPSFEQFVYGAYTTASPITVASDPDFFEMYVEELFEEDGSHSPGSVSLCDSCRPLTTESPIPQYNFTVFQPVLYTRDESSSSTSLASDYECCDFYVEDLFQEMRADSPDTTSLCDDNRQLSPDSPIPDYHPAKLESLPLKGSRSSSTTSLLSDIEYPELCLDKLFSQDRSWSPDSSRSPNAYRPLSPDSPIPQFVCPNVHQCVYAGGGLHSPIPPEFDIEYSEMCLEELFSENRAESPDSEMQDKCTGRTIPDCYNLRSLSPDYLTSENDYTLYKLSLGEERMSSPESYSSENYYRIFCADSPVPQYGHVSCDTARYSWTARPSSPDSSIASDIEFSELCLDELFREDRAWSPDSPHSPGPHRPLSPDSPIHDFCHAKLDSILNIKSRSSSTTSLLSDIEYPELCLNELFSQDRSWSPDSSHSPNTYRPLSPDSPIPQFVCSTVCPSLYRCGVLHSPIPLESDIEYSEMCIEELFSEKRAESPDSEMQDKCTGRTIPDCYNLRSLSPDSLTSENDYSLYKLWHEEERMCSPESYSSENYYIIFCADSPVPQYGHISCDTARYSWAARQSSPDSSIASDIEFSELSLGELFREDKAWSPDSSHSPGPHRPLSPDSPIPVYVCPTCEHFTYRCYRTCPSPVSVTSDIEYSEMDIQEHLHDDRPYSPQSVASLDMNRELSPDSPVPQYGFHICECFNYTSNRSSSPTSLVSDIEYSEMCLEALFSEGRPESPESVLLESHTRRIINSSGEDRPLSPDSLTSENEYFITFHEWLEEERPSSPQSCVSLNEYRPLSPDSPTPEYSHYTHDQQVCFTCRSSPISLSSDIEYSDFYLEELFREIRTDSPDSTNLSEQYCLSADSPIPDFGLAKLDSILYTKSRSSSTTSLLSDTEYPELCLKELFSQDRSWSPDSSHSPNTYRPLSPDSPIPQFVCPNIHQYVYAGSGLHSPIPPESDIEYSEMCLEELFSENRAESPDSEMQDKCTGRTIPDRYNLRSLSPESIASENDYSLYSLNWFEEERTSSPESFTSDNYCRILWANSPVPQYDHIWCDTARQTWAARSISPDSSIASDIEFSELCLDKLFREDRSWSPDSSHSPGPHRTLSTESPIPDFGHAKLDSILYTKSRSSSTTSLLSDIEYPELCLNELFSQDRSWSPDSSHSPNTYRPLSPDSPIPQFVCPNIHQCVYAGSGSISPIPPESDIEYSDMGLEELFSENRAESPDSEMHDKCIDRTTPDCYNLRPLSPESIASENDYTLYSLNWFEEERTSSPESFTSDNYCRILWADSPVPQYDHISFDTARQTWTARSISPESSIASDIEYSQLCLDELFREGRSWSPDSTHSPGPHRPLSPDSPIPEYSHSTHDQQVCFTCRSSSPISLASDIEYSDFYLEELFQEMRADSPDTSSLLDDNRQLSPDSPIPDYNPAKLESLPLKGSRSSSTTSLLSDIEYPELSLDELFSQDRSWSPDSSHSPNTYRPLSPDSPIPQFVSPNIHQCVYKSSGLDSPIPPEFDIEYSEMCLEELFSENRAESPDSEMQDKCTDRNTPDCYNLRPLSPESIASENYYNLYSLNWFEEERTSSPESFSSDNYCRILWADSPVPQYDHIWCDTARQTWTARSISPESSIASDIEYSQLCLDELFREDGAWSPDSSHSPGPHRPLSTDSPIPVYGCPTYTKPSIRATDCEVSASDDIAFNQKGRLRSKVGSHQLMSHIYDPLFKGTHLSNTVMTMDQTESGLKRTAERNTDESARDQSQIIEIWDQVQARRRRLWSRDRPDSPECVIPESHAIRTTISSGEHRPSSPDSLTSGNEYFNTFYEWLEEDRPSSPESCVSLKEHRPLSPDSPIPDYCHYTHDQKVCFTCRPSSPISLASDIEYSDFYLEELFQEIRADSPDSANLSEEYRLSADSPIPYFGHAKLYSILYTKSRSSSTTSLLSDIEYPELCLNELFSQDRSWSPDSSHSPNTYRPLSPDSPIPQFVCPNVHQCVYAGGGSHSPIPPESDIEYSEMGLEELFCENRAESPDSEMQDKCTGRTIPECYNLRPLSPESIASENDYTLYSLNWFEEERTSSPESFTSDNYCRILWADSPVPQYGHICCDTAKQTWTARSISPDSSIASDIEFSELCLDELFKEDRAWSPDSSHSPGPHRTLSTESPIPDFGHAKLDSILYTKSRSSSTTSLLSDIEYPELCLNELFSQDRPWSPDSSHSPNTYRPLSPDSPIPQFVSPNIHQCVYKSSGLDSPIPPEFDIEYSDMYLEELFSENRAESPDSEMQDKCTDRNTPDCYNLRPLSPESIASENYYNLYSLNWFEEERTSSPESFTSDNYCRILWADSPVPQYDHIWCDTARQTWTARSISPESSIASDIEYSQLCLDELFREDGAWSPDPSHSPGPHRPLSTDSPIPVYGFPTYTKPSIRATECEVSASDDIAFNQKGRLMSKVGSHQLMSHIYDPLFKGTHLSYTVMTMDQTESGLKRTAERNTEEWARDQSQIIEIWDQVQARGQRLWSGDRPDLPECVIPESHAIRTTISSGEHRPSSPDSLTSGNEYFNTFYEWLEEDRPSSPESCVSLKEHRPLSPDSPIPDYCHYTHDQKVCFTCRPSSPISLASDIEYSDFYLEELFQEIRADSPDSANLSEEYRLSADSPIPYFGHAKLYSILYTKSRSSSTTSLLSDIEYPELCLNELFSQDRSWSPDSSHSPNTYRPLSPDSPIPQFVCPNVHQCVYAGGGSHSPIPPESDIEYSEMCLEELFSENRAESPDSEMQDKCTDRNTPDCYNLRPLSPESIASENDYTLYSLNWFEEERTSSPESFTSDNYCRILWADSPVPQYGHICCDTARQTWTARSISPDSSIASDIEFSELCLDELFKEDRAWSPDSSHSPGPHRTLSTESPIPDFGHAKLDSILYTKSRSSSTTSLLSDIEYPELCLNELFSQDRSWSPDSSHSPNTYRPLSPDSPIPQFVCPNIHQCVYAGSGSISPIPPESDIEYSDMGLEELFSENRAESPDSEMQDKCTDRNNPDCYNLRPLSPESIASENDYTLYSLNWFEEERTSSPESFTSDNYCRILWADSPVPQYDHIPYDTARQTWTARSISPESSIASDIEYSQLCLDELFREGRSWSPDSTHSPGPHRPLSPDSPISEYFHSTHDQQVCFTCRSSSPISLASDIEYSDFYLEELFQEMRADSPDTSSLLDDNRQLSPDSPIPDYNPAKLESLPLKGSRSSSTTSLLSDIEYPELSLDELFSQDRSWSPDSSHSPNTYRPLSPDSPIPQFVSPNIHQCVYKSSGLDSPIPPEFDIEYSEMCLEELFSENRAESPDSEMQDKCTDRNNPDCYNLRPLSPESIASENDYSLYYLNWFEEERTSSPESFTSDNYCRILSADSPVPQYDHILCDTARQTWAARSISPDSSILSDIEFSELCLDELFREDKSWSPDSSHSPGPHRPLSTDSPIPDFGHAKLDSILYTKSRSSSTTSLLSDIEYPELCLNELFSQDRSWSPDSSHSPNTYRPLSPDSPIQQFVCPNVHQCVYAGSGSHSPIPPESDIEYSEMCLEELFSENRAESPDSEIQDKCTDRTIPDCYLRSLSPESIGSENDYPLYYLNWFEEERTSSPESFTSDNYCRILWADSPVPQYDHIPYDTARQTWTARSISPESSIASDIEYSQLCLDELFREGRSWSPDSNHSPGPHRPLSPDSPISEYFHSTHDQQVCFTCRSSSPISLASDIEYSDFYLEELFQEMRADSPETTGLWDDNRQLSPDSPIPDYHPAKLESLPLKGSRSSSTTSLLSDIEYPELCLDELFSQDRSWSPDSSHSPKTYRPLSPDSPIPQFVCPNIHQCVYAGSGLDSPIPPEFDVEYSDMCLEELFSENRADSPDSEMQDKCTDRNAPDCYNLRSLSPESIASENDYTLYYLNWFEEERTSSPESFTSDNYCRILSADSPVPQYDHIWSDTARQTWVARSISPESSIASDIEYSQLCLDELFREDRSWSPDSSHSPGPHRPLSPDSPTPVYGRPTCEHLTYRCYRNCPSPESVTCGYRSPSEYLWSDVEYADDCYFHIDERTSSPESIIDSYTVNSYIPTIHSQYGSYESSATVKITSSNLSMTPDYRSAIALSSTSNSGRESMNAMKSRKRARKIKQQLPDDAECCKTKIILLDISDELDCSLETASFTTMLSANCFGSKSETCHKSVQQQIEKTTLREEMVVQTQSIESHNETWEYGKVHSNIHHTTCNSHAMSLHQDTFVSSEPDTPDIYLLTKSGVKETRTDQSVRSISPESLSSHDYYSFIDRERWAEEIRSCSPNSTTSVTAYSALPPDSPLPQFIGTHERFAVPSSGIKSLTNSPSSESDISDSDGALCCQDSVFTETRNRSPDSASSVSKPKCFSHDSQVPPCRELPYSYADAVKANRSSSHHSLAPHTTDIDNYSADCNEEKRPYSADSLTTETAICMLPECSRNECRSVTPESLTSADELLYASCFKDRRPSSPGTPTTDANCNLPPDSPVPQYYLNPTVVSHSTGFQCSSPMSAVSDSESDGYYYLQDSFLLEERPLVSPDSVSFSRPLTPDSPVPQFNLCTPQIIQPHRSASPLSMSSDTECYENSLKCEHMSHEVRPESPMSVSADEQYVFASETKYSLITSSPLSQSAIIESDNDLSEDLYAEIGPSPEALSLVSEGRHLSVDSPVQQYHNLEDSTMYSWGQSCSSHSCKSVSSDTEYSQHSIEGLCHKERTNVPQSQWRDSDSETRSLSPESASTSGSIEDFLMELCQWRRPSSPEAYCELDAFSILSPDSPVPQYGCSLAVNFPHSTYLRCTSALSLISENSEEEQCFDCFTESRPMSPESACSLSEFRPLSPDSPVPYYGHHISLSALTRSSTPASLVSDIDIAEPESEPFSYNERAESPESAILDEENEGNMTFFDILEPKMIPDNECEPVQFKLFSDLVRKTSSKSDNIIGDPSALSSDVLLPQCSFPPDKHILPFTVCTSPSAEQSELDNKTFSENERLDSYELESVHSESASPSTTPMILYSDQSELDIEICLEKERPDSYGPESLQSKIGECRDMHAVVAQRRPSPVSDISDSDGGAQLYLDYLDDYTRPVSPESVSSFNEYTCLPADSPVPQFRTLFSNTRVSFPRDRSSSPESLKSDSSDEYMIFDLEDVFQTRPESPQSDFYDNECKGTVSSSPSSADVIAKTETVDNVTSNSVPVLQLVYKAVPNKLMAHVFDPPYKGETFTSKTGVFERVDPRM
ncbi:uncharacterized protein LOC134465518 isoform X2 [Engraulis encrasicolus]|uniref:uncharacterized protein LOC134465518 isoform X2 n=1 Tax=Engraulis encrasicolus TaxID=184585 RepID=UPI002FD748BD